MELLKNNGIWVKGDSELNPLEPVVTESTVYSFIPDPTEGSPASLEIRAEVYVTPYAEVMMHLRTAPPPITSLSPWLPAMSYLCVCVIHFKTMRATEV